MTEELKLRECPFCGGEMMFRAALWPSDGDSDGIIHKDVQGGPDGCCGVMSFSNGTSDRQIIAAWNRRAPSPEVTALVEAARASLEAMKRHIPEAHGVHPNPEYQIVEDMAAALAPFNGEKP